MENKVASSIKNYHDTRFTYDENRDVLWKTLCEAYFQRRVPEDGCVLELGAGYAHFINHISCKTRLAVDAWDGLRGFVSEGVAAHIGSVTDLSLGP